MSSQDNSSSKAGVTLMEVSGILLDPVSQAPVVVLQSEDKKIELPIWIGMSEATSIAATLKKLQLNRPLTHDLFVTMMDELQIEVEQVLITDLRDDTFFAELVFSVGEKAIVLDARPSDAIAIALRTNSPVYVANSVIKKAIANISAQQANEGEQSEKTAKESQTEQPEAEQTLRNKSLKDLRYVDKSKWSEILEALEIDDKYKA